MIRSAALAVTLCVIAVAFADQSGVYSESQAKNGQIIYRKVCSNCHAEDLAGAEHAPALKGDPFWREWDQQKARLLYRRIISTMPSDDPGSLPEKDVIDIVAFLLKENGLPVGAKAIESANQLNDITLERPK
ncbi:MAG: cytochrome c [Bryobacteraceae bacterium]|jgi:cytochrome c5